MISINRGERNNKLTNNKIKLRNVWTSHNEVNQIPTIAQYKLEFVPWL